MLDEVVIQPGSSIKDIEKIRKQNFPDLPRVWIKIHVEKRGDNIVMLMSCKPKSK